MLDSTVDDATANETDGDFPDDSEEDSANVDHQIMERPIDLSIVKKQPSYGDLAEIPRQSPKRKRGLMDTSSRGNLSSFLSPNPQAVYQQYGQFHGTSPQIQLAGPAPGTD
jgi:hypothetical protein